MMIEATLDSSVFVSAFVKGEEHRPTASVIIKRMFDGKLRVVTSVIVPVEVCGAIARRASPEAARKAMTQIRKWGDLKLINYSELTEDRSRESAELALSLRLKGMDAIVIQVSKEMKSPLVTFDQEMAKRARTVTTVLEPAALTSELNPDQ